MRIISDTLRFFVLPVIVSDEAEQQVELQMTSTPLTLNILEQGQP